MSYGKPLSLSLRKEEMEVSRLKREIAELKMERDIQKNASSLSPILHNRPPKTVLIAPITG
jgi:transposase-like protein